MFYFQAIVAAAAFKFFAAILALNKQQMTRAVFAITMRVGFFAALMTIANNFICYLLAYARRNELYSRRNAASDGSTDENSGSLAEKIKITRLQKHAR